MLRNVNFSHIMRESGATLFKKFIIYERMLDSWGLEFNMKMKIKQFSLLLGVFTINVQAQQDGIPMGTFTLFPTVGLSYGYDDNFSYTNSEDFRLSSSFATISPGVRLHKEGERFDFLAQYDFNKTFVNSDSRYNFYMNHLLGSLGYTASRRSNFHVSAEYYFGLDRIGTANQQGNLLNLGLDPDEWHSFGVNGKWHYGGIGAKGAIDMELGFINREYDNNQQYTASRARDTQYYGITYSHNISPKTNLLAQYKYTDIDYTIATLDSVERRYMFGAEWQITGKTGLRALIGNLSKDFKDPSHANFNGIALEAGMTWSPRSYSIFDLTLSRETDETNGNGSYVIRNSADLGWTHFWKDKISTTANIGFSDEVYDGSFRDDKVNFYGLSLKYQMSRYVVFGLGYRNLERGSSFDEFTYNDNSYLLTIEVSK